MDICDSIPADPSSNLLISVPGGTDGPGGVLIGSEDFLVWKNQDHTEVCRG